MNRSATGFEQARLAVTAAAGLTRPSFAASLAGWVAGMTLSLAAATGVMAAESAIVPGRSPNAWRDPTAVVRVTRPMPSVTTAGAAVADGSVVDGITDREQLAGSEPVAGAAGGNLVQRTLGELSPRNLRNRFAEIGRGLRGAGPHTAPRPSASATEPMTQRLGDAQAEPVRSRLGDSRPDPAWARLSDDGPVTQRLGDSQPHAVPSRLAASTDDSARARLRDAAGSPIAPPLADLSHHPPILRLADSESHPENAQRTTARAGSVIERPVDPQPASFASDAATTTPDAASGRLSDTQAAAWASEVIPTAPLQAVPAQMNPAILAGETREPELLATHRHAPLIPGPAVVDPARLSGPADPGSPGKLQPARALHLPEPGGAERPPATSLAGATAPGAEPEARFPVTRLPFTVSRMHASAASPGGTAGGQPPATMIGTDPVGPALAAATPVAERPSVGSSFGKAPTTGRVADSGLLSNFDRVLLAERRRDSAAVGIGVASRPDAAVSQFAASVPDVRSGTDADRLTDRPSLQPNAAHGDASNIAFSRPPAGLSFPASAAPQSSSSERPRLVAVRPLQLGENSSPATEVTAAPETPAEPLVKQHATVRRFQRTCLDRLARVSPSLGAGRTAGSGGDSSGPTAAHLDVLELEQFLGGSAADALGESVAFGGQRKWMTSAAEPARGEPALVEPPGVLSDGLRPIQAVRTDIQPSEGELPWNPAAERFAQQEPLFHGLGTNRAWPVFPFQWAAPAWCHRPLYYEEQNLERYGFSRPCIQPALSAAHFFGSTFALPWLMLADPPGECVYPLGAQRVGSPARF